MHVRTHGSSLESRSSRRWRPRTINPVNETVLFQTEVSYTLCPFPRDYLDSLRLWARRRRAADATAGHGLQHEWAGGGVAVCVKPASVCQVAWALGLAAVVVVDGRVDKGREQPVRCSLCCRVLSLSHSFRSI